MKNSKGFVLTLPTTLELVAGMRSGVRPGHVESNRRRIKRLRTHSQQKAQLKRELVGGGD